MNVQGKVWNTTRTGFKVHAFKDGHAECRSSIKEGVAPAHTHQTARRWVLDTPGLSFCASCEYVVRLQDQVQASAEENAAAEQATPAPVQVARVTTTVNVTPEMIEALLMLRRSVRGYGMDTQTAQALVILDDAGIFAVIDEATGYDVDPEPEPVQVGSEEWHSLMGAALAETPLYAHRKRDSKCTCPAARAHHLNRCPRSPAKWGDTAYTTPEAAKEEQARRSLIQGHVGLKF